MHRNAQINQLVPNQSLTDLLDAYVHLEENMPRIKESVEFLARNDIYWPDQADEDYVRSELVRIGVEPTPEEIAASLDIMMKIPITVIRISATDEITGEDLPNMLYVVALWREPKKLLNMIGLPIGHDIKFEVLEPSDDVEKFITSEGEYANKYRLLYHRPPSPPSPESE